jgi:hypothetical protein
VQSNDSHEIVSLRGRVNELQGRCDIIEAENRQNMEMLGGAHKDVGHYKDMS